MGRNNTDYFSLHSAMSEAAAAVAIIRCLSPTESILLVRRSHNSTDPWSGHFAFPGGRRERCDASILATCTREVAEETGIELVSELLVETLPVTPAGRILRSPVLVQPFLFEIDRRPEVRPAVSEIASYLWLETASFLNHANHTVTEVVPGVSRPVFPLADYYIWGFTYGVLCRLFAVDQKDVGTIG